MSEEKIKNIASQYICQHQISAEEAYYENKRQIELGDVLPILEWLSKDYCIVPKSEVVDWVNTLENFMPTPHSKMMIIGAKRLFGSELFEQKGE